MGISGLLPLLKSVQKPTHLSELAGMTIAVDAYVWLHRGAYACAPELVQGKYTTRYIDYAMYRVRLLQHYKITPYLVFDGGHLPAKQGTEVERRRKREGHLALANSLTQQGRHTEAREHFIKCVDITPQMAFQLIKALRAENVSYVVAPYEADAQLAYLERSGIVNGILTEDSDLLIFGANLLLLKLDAPNATCISISSDRLASNAPSDLALYGWSTKELRECALLSGCDYLQGVRGVGIKTAGKIMRRWGTIERALRSLRMDGKFVERDWEHRMRIAEAAFLHQRVWDPRTETVVYLTSPDTATWNEEKERFVGRHIEPELACRLARGDVDPITFEPMVDIMPSFQPSTNSRLRPLALIDSNRQINAPPISGTTPAKRSLLHYFAKKSKPTVVTPSPAAAATSLPISTPALTMHVGGMSGKRTLAEQYDRETDYAMKRPRIDDGVVHCSKFFTQSLVQSAFDDDKENLEELEYVDVVPTEDVDIEIDPVKQEDGYMSPMSPGPAFSSPGSQRGATPDFSSPLQAPPLAEENTRPRTPLRTVENITPSCMQTAEQDKADIASDDGRITSPPSGRGKQPLIPRRSNSKVTMVTMYDLHPGPKPQDDDVFGSNRLSVDLRGIFSESPNGKVVRAVKTIPPNMETKLMSVDAQSEGIECIEDEEEFVRRAEERHRIVSKGWEKRYACTSGARGTLAPRSTKGKENTHSRPTLRRCETMAIPVLPVTPLPCNHHAVSRPRGSKLAVAKSPEWVPPPLISPSFDIEEGSLDGDMLSGPSSQGAVVDDGGASPISRARIRLRAYRFR